MAAADSTPPALTDEQVKRFWAKVAKAGPDDCWLWTGAPHKSGYAFFRARPKKLKAHTLARFLATGEWPGRGLETCHSCDARYPAGDTTYRLCCNPAHLWLGTHAANMADMASKGRNKTNQVRGERQGSSKLTAPEVIEIRRLHATGAFTLAELGERFGAHLCTVHNVVTRVSWRHLP